MQENTERNREIMAMLARGRTQRSIAENFGIALSTLSEIIGRERARNPIDKAAEIATQVEILDRLIEEASAIVDMRAAPVTAGKDGDIVRDPEDQAVVRDHSGRLAAMAIVKQLQERKAKLLGLDSATKTEVAAAVTYTIEGVDPDGIG